MYYTYVHVTADTGNIFYVGKGTGRRMNRRDARNQHWWNVVNKHGYKVQKLADWSSEAEAFEHEKVLISCFKDMGFKLVNQSSGGDGNDAAGGLSFKGKKHTEQAKLKCKVANLGKKASEEAKQKNRQKHQKQIKINGIIYPSWHDASVATGIPVGSLSWLMKPTKRTKKWVGFVVEAVM
jgi:alkylated DNA nucleotide flippase Atl1